MESSDEVTLLRSAFGEDWKRAIIERLNVYDLSKTWPAYQRADGLGIFAAAVLKNKLPIVGHGKTAWRMRLDLEKVFVQRRMLDPTMGIAGFLNNVLLETGLERRPFFERQMLMETFLNFSSDFQKDLLVGIMFDSMEDFYSDLSQQWKEWSRGDLSASGKVSPIDIWAYYAMFEMRPTREELETVLAMHKEEAANVIMDLEVGNLGRRCGVCAKRASTLCAGCKVQPYCSATCQREDWDAHAENCGN
jgi:hypothetical protein